MSKQFKNTDDLFRSVFANDAAEVPAFIKQNIDQRLSKKRKKRGWFWIGGFTLAGLLAASVTQLFLIEETHSVHKTELNGEQADEQINPRSEEQTGVQSTEEKTTQTVKTDHISSTGTLNSDTQSGSASANTDQSFLTPHFENGPDLASTDADTKSPDTSDTGKLNDTTTGNNERATDTFDSPDTDFESLHPDSGWMSAGIKQQSPVWSVMNARFENNQNNLSANFQTNLTSHDSDPEKIVRTENLLHAKSIEPREIYNPWLLSLSGGMAISDSRYTSANSAEETEFSQSNTDQPGFEGNFDAKYRLKNSLTFGTGAGISQLKSDYAYFRQEIDIDTSITWNYQDIYVYDTLLDSLVYVGTDSTSTTNYDTTAVTLYDAQGSTQASYLHIPFSIGTQIIRNKFIFDFYLMGRFNFLLGSSGGYLANNQYQTINGSNTLFRKSSLDILIGASIHYNLFGKFYVNGSFRFHPPISKLYEGVSINRSVQSYHIGIGISYKL